MRTTANLPVTGKETSGTGCLNAVAPGTPHLGQCNWLVFSGGQSDLLQHFPTPSSRPTRGPCLTSQAGQVIPCWVSVPWSSSVQGTGSTPRCYWPMSDFPFLAWTFPDITACGWTCHPTYCWTRSLLNPLHRSLFICRGCCLRKCAFRVTNNCSAGCHLRPTLLFWRSWQPHHCCRRWRADGVPLVPF
jgi:hypothetical protein